MYKVKLTISRDTRPISGGGVPYPYMDRQMQYARNIYGYDTSVMEPRRRAHKHHVHS